jgi:hypothetical protein
MRRTAFLVVVAVLASLLTWQRWPASPIEAGRAGGAASYSLPDIQAILHEWRRLEEYSQRSASFREVLLASDSNLAAGTQSLAEATRAVLIAARRDNPKFLRLLRDSQPNGRSECECIALNLIRRLENGINAPDFRPEPQERLQKLRAEMATPAFQTACAREGIDSPRCDDSAE